jgi:hypothetical protein
MEGEAQTGRDAVSAPAGGDNDGARELAAELDRLWLGVIREQAGEEAYKAFMALREACLGWRGAPSDGDVIGQIEFFTECEPGLRKTVTRACVLATALTDFAFAVAPSLARAEAEIAGIEQPVSRDPKTGLPLDFSKLTLEDAARALAAAGLKPLPARPYPPYPQLQLHLSQIWPAATASRDQLACLRRIAELLVDTVPAPTTGARRAGLLRTLRAELVLLWQSRTSAPRNPVGEGIVYRESDTDPTAEEWLLELIPEFNDRFANTLHIDPRFANFIPFVRLSGDAFGEEYGGNSEGDTNPPGHSSRGIIASARRGRRTAISLYVSQLSRLAVRLTQHKENTQFGARMHALWSRLSMDNPVYAAVVEREGPGQTARQTILHIVRRLENALLRGAHASGADSEPASSLDRLREPAYAAASQVLLDLKHLHQAVAETYGGVAFAPDVRRVLMAVGAFRFAPTPLTAHFDRVTPFSCALSIGKAAGLIHSDTAYPGTPESMNTFSLLASNPDRLATALDAGSLDHGSREFISFLRAAREVNSTIDPTAVEGLALWLAEEADKLPALLAVVRAIDWEARQRGGESLEGRLSFSLETLTAIDLSRDHFRDLPYEDLLHNMADAFDVPAVKAWLEQRGGLLEVHWYERPALSREWNQWGPWALLGLTQLHGGFPHSWEDRCSVAHACRESRERGITPVFHIGFIHGSAEIGDEAATLMSFGAGCINQHVRLPLITVGGSRSQFCREVAEPWLESVTAALTLASYQHSGAEPVQPEAGPKEWSTVADQLAQIARDRSAALQEAVKSSVADRLSWSTREALLRDIEPWFGLGEAAADLLAIGGKNADALRLAAREWPFLRWQIALARRAMAQADLRVLALTAWYRLPKGSYGTVFPAIEAGWNRAKQALDSLAADLPPDWDSGLAKIMAKRPYTDALTLLNLAGEEL